MSDVRAASTQDRAGTLWRSAEVNSLGSLRKGRGIRKNEVLRQGLPCIRYGELYTKYDEHFENFFSYISEDVAKTAEVLQHGDIVFAGSGETAEDIGKCAVYLGTSRAFVGSDTIVLRPTAASPAFLGFALNTLAVKQQLARFAQGDAIVHVGLASIGKIMIPLPPLGEQQTIGEVLLGADALIDSLDKLVAKKRAMKQGAMQQLLTGKTRLPGFSGEWEARKLAEIAAFQKGFGLPKSAIDPTQAHPCIHYGELFTIHGFRITKVVSRTNGRNASVLANPNDVLMPTSDVTPTGLATASAIEDHGIAIGGDVLIIRPNSDLLSGAFLASVVRFHRQQILSLVTGSTVYHIYASEMKKFRFLAPSVEEQRAIVEVLIDMDAEIDALVARREKTALIKTGMMQELLTGRTRLV